MKAAIAYYLMLLYITVMFKPLIPIVKDTIAHTFAEAIHIATVHAIYGSNHLQKEISETTSDNNKQQSTSTNEDQFPVHVSAKEYLYDFSSALIFKKYFYLHSYNLKSGFITKHSPPPRFC
jgi:DNA repair photolyase